MYGSDSKYVYGESITRKKKKKNVSHVEFTYVWNLVIVLNMDKVLITFINQVSAEFKYRVDSIIYAFCSSKA